eukprot:GFUD01060374.1.p1 GENE.GFUD01060374.1~~GFUD01060374.1.p1  ORF type:complete len:110 (-),score=18.18 GFUD01060374.1:275-604(-)
MTDLFLLIFVLFISSGTGQMIVGADMTTEFCNGSIKLYSAFGEVAVFTEVQSKMMIKAHTALVEGCGCYRLYERKNYRGRSYHANRREEHHIGLRRVKSLALVPCFWWI